MTDHWGSSKLPGKVLYYQIMELRDLKFFIEEGQVSVNDRIEGEPLLRFVFSKGIPRDDEIKLAMVKYLLANGADPNCRDVTSWSRPLYLAVVRNKLSIVRELLNAGAEVETEEGSVLHDALGARVCPDIVSLLLKQGNADLNRYCSGMPLEMLPHFATTNCPYHTAEDIDRAEVLKKMIHNATATQPLLFLCANFIADHCRHFEPDTVRAHLPQELIDLIRCHLKKRQRYFHLNPIDWL